jgi:hypothetical protein
MHTNIKKRPAYRPDFIKEHCISVDDAITVHGNKQAQTMIYPGGIV